ncbi:MAG: 4Fe-4S binding protein [Alphaproteobacteria bacterium]
MTGRRTFVTRILAPSKQRSLPGRYALWVQGLSMAAFAWAFLGWLNETWLFWWDSPVWFNRYTEYVLILCFGLWRIAAEHNPYTRRRLVVLVACVAVLWGLIPWQFPFFEPYVGYPGRQPEFPSLHTPGTLTFFLVLAAVLLFGRRVICGWNCPCVGIRETVGFPFRHVTPRGRWAWRLRHTKWIFFTLYVGAGVVLLSPLNSWSEAYLGFFGLVVVLPYFATLFLSPLTGNRSYCRYLCPFGATFGLLNKVGFYRIDYDERTCTDCGTCLQVCDMGIPVVELGRRSGKVDVADCMGCGRCVTECPTGSLVFRDVRDVVMPGSTRDVIAPGSTRDRSHLRRWATSDRLQAGAFAAALMVAVAGAAWYSAAVGTPAELATDLGASLCRIH